MILQETALIKKRGHHNVSERVNPRPIIKARQMLVYNREI